MTPNSKLNMLIARIEGGEKLTREMDFRIDCALKGLAWDESEYDGYGGGIWKYRYQVEGDKKDSGLYVPLFHESIDAVMMSLARNAEEARRIFGAAYLNDDLAYAACKEATFNPEPVLRAMLLEALRARRT